MPMPGPVYPRPLPSEEIVPLDETVLAGRIIAQREEYGRTKEQAVGFCLVGSNDLPGFYRMWETIERERLAARAVNPADHGTATSYKTAVTEAAPHLNAQTFYDGLKAELGVTSFSDLKKITSTEVA